MAGRYLTAVAVRRSGRGPERRTADTTGANNGSVRRLLRRLVRGSAEQGGLIFRYPVSRAANRKRSSVDCDSNQPGKPTTEPPTQPSEPGAVVCLVTGIAIDSPRPRQRFVSVTQLKSLYSADRHTFDRIAARFLTVKQTGVTLDQQCYYMAHNIRNAYANQFNNPLRRLKKYLRGNKRPLLFALSKAQLTGRIQAGIEYRAGTRYEVNL